MTRRGFKTPDEAEVSSAAIEAKFMAYLDAGDFVGADLARKVLQMGFTRARRYANWREEDKHTAAENRRRGAQKAALKKAGKTRWWGPHQTQCRTGGRPCAGFEGLGRF